MEKLQIRFSFLIRYLAYHFVFWYLALLFFVFLTGENQIFQNYFRVIEIDSLFLNIFYQATALTVIFTFFDGLFSDRIMRHSPIRLLTILRAVLYLLIVLVIFILASHPPRVLLSIKDWATLKNLLPQMNTSFFRFLAYFYFACILNSFFKHMVKRIGRGNYLKWLWGLMNKPREEKRIFMFIDMASSTTIAEKLGHKKFSYLVQDAFNDLVVVDNYKGDIYQYLGDGAIISWTVNKGIQNNNCIKAFFAFQRLIEKRSRAYERKYGLVPKFKAGIHVGDIMVLQVGQIRRDISYNGDTLNTAARIESLCNQYRQDLLISGDLHKILKNKKEFQFKCLEDVKLKGKRKKTDIIQVRKKPGR